MIDTVKVPVHGLFIKLKSYLNILACIYLIGKEVEPPSI